MEYIFFTKTIITITLVILLSVIAERVSPRVAGLLAGYPLGSALALFFIGLEMSPEFAAKSAVYTMIGLVASECFVWVYFKATLFFHRYTVIAASFFATVTYFFIIWLLHFIKINKFVAVLIPVASIFLFVYLFKGIQNMSIKNRAKLTFKLLFLRALLTAIIILTVTGTAKWVGPKWAGLFSAFPFTLFPLILIVHLTYHKKYAHTIIKNFPLGMGSLISYLLTIAVIYPILGIYPGTLISLAVATLYMFIYGMFFSWTHRRQRIGGATSANERN